MTTPWPAFADMLEDDTLTLSAFRVYMRLVRSDPQIFHRPRDVKMWLLARELKVEKETAIDAVRLLIDRGYLIDCGRGPSRVRKLQIALVRHSTPIPTIAPAA